MLYTRRCGAKYKINLKNKLVRHFQKGVVIRRQKILVRINTCFKISQQIVFFLYVSPQNQHYTDILIIFAITRDH